MSNVDADQLRAYLEMVSKKHGGAEQLVSDLTAGSQERPAGLEGLERQAGPGAALESLRRPDAEMAPDIAFGLEALIASDIRPVIDIVNGSFTSTHALWTQLSDDAVLKNRIMASIPAIGRVELVNIPGIPYGGTGFVVGAGLLMTNRHVAEIFAAGLGERSVSFMPGVGSEIDFLRELNNARRAVLKIRKIRMIHPYWDMAILEVEGLPATITPLELSLDDARELPAGHDIYVIGYPAFDGRNPSAEQQSLFRGSFGVKRLQPGELQGAVRVGSFGKIVDAAAHDCSTLGGNSGSAILDLANGRVLGLHFGGKYMQKNYAVPSAALAQDGRVVAAGVRFAGTPSGGPNIWGDWWLRADASEAAQPAADAAPRRDDAADSKTASGGGVTMTGLPGGAITLDVPLRITLSFGEPRLVGATVTGAAESVVMAAETEALREPDHDTDYASRKGYDPAFLGGDDAGADERAVLAVPMPTASNQAVLAKTRNGGDELSYQNFSLRMHAARRLAFVTASNVTKEPKLKKPDPAGDYTRRGLSGLGKNDQEKWFFDSRLDAAFQLPDVFFTKDRKAFDKGHIVRRDDVAWGRSYQEVRRANGDSFHVTNCSPQVAGFNRSSDGEDNWGDLENHVLSEAASERLCVLAGPVLADSDEVFVGVGDGGAVLRAKIPGSYWKVIAARTEDGLATYGFVLEQDLSDVDFEFVVPAEFVAVMRPLHEIAAKTGVVFDPALLAADQFNTVRGEAVGRRARARRPSRP
ncbi:DNA/RNA non-specific endonuclease [Bosea sp. BK604]|uniref:DNA/RNA non-specific endonuclease n=1 Tax=Bosea sp. BK604 TaxID=2512180 RepID=UPI00104D1CFF|nr:DNA/RNA non-specific endonuclease [Bosea sp. BK604]TCR65245.1 endonuclease G [Bosea sp. BK604]